MATPGYEIPSYNAPGPIELPAELPMRGVTEIEYANLSYFAPSHANDHQNQYFNLSINGPGSLRGGFEIPEPDEISHHRMHLDSDPSPMSSQSFINTFEEQARQVVLANFFD